MMNWISNNLLHNYKKFWGILGSCTAAGAAIAVFGELFLSRGNSSRKELLAAASSGALFGLISIPITNSVIKLASAIDDDGNVRVSTSL